MNIDLEELSYRIHCISREKGLWEEKQGEERVNQLLAKMMLLTREVSEMADCYVCKEDPQFILNEMAHIVIKMLDIYASMNRKENLPGKLSEKIIEKVENYQ